MIPYCSQLPWLFWKKNVIQNFSQIAIFKHEDQRKEKVKNDDDQYDDDGEGDEILGVVDTYKQLLKIVALPLMPATIVILLTSKIGFSAADSVTGLKLVSIHNCCLVVAEWSDIQMPSDQYFGLVFRCHSETGLVFRCICRATFFSDPPFLRDCSLCWGPTERYTCMLPVSCST